MAAKAVVVRDQFETPLVNAEVSLHTKILDYTFPLTNPDGYTLSTIGFGPGEGYIKVVANGSKQYLQKVTLDGENQEIHCSNDVWGPPNTINLPPVTF